MGVEGEIVAKLVPEFEAQNPSIKVKTLQIAWAAAHEKLITSYVSGTLPDVFQQVLTHEEYISASINDLYATCTKEKDFTSANYLQWYITEQIEEESTVRSILDQIKLAGGEKGGMFMMDKEFAAMAATKRASLAQSGGANAIV